MNDKGTIVRPPTDKGDDKKPTLAMRFSEGVQNIAGKVVGVFGAGIIGYVALTILFSIAMFVLKIGVAIAFIHGMCSSKRFELFRHHLNELIIAPVKAFCFNSFLRPLLNSSIDAWNYFFDYKQMELYTSTPPKGFDLFIRIGNVGIIFGNIALSLRNRIAEKLSSFGGVLHYEERTSDQYRLSKTDSSLPEGSILSLGYEFVKGTALWSYDAAIYIKDLNVSIFSTPQAVPLPLDKAPSEEDASGMQIVENYEGPAPSAPELILQNEPDVDSYSTAVTSIPPIAFSGKSGVHSDSGSDRPIHEESLRVSTQRSTIGGG